MGILTGLNSALCCKSRASYTNIGNKKTTFLVAIQSFKLNLFYSSVSCICIKLCGVSLYIQVAGNISKGGNYRYGNQ